MLGRDWDDFAYGMRLSSPDFFDIKLADSLPSIRVHWDKCRSNQRPFSVFAFLMTFEGLWQLDVPRHFPHVFVRRLPELSSHLVTRFMGLDSVQRLDPLDLPEVMTAPFSALDGCTGARMGPDFWQDFS